MLESDIMKRRAFQRKHQCLFLFILILFTWGAVAGNWPAWRGPEGTGVAKENNVPLHWSTNENICWRAPLPDRGNSTPIVWEKRVFVTQTEGSRRMLMCFDRMTGKLLWQQGPMYAEAEPTHETNPICSSSPVTDGERVIAWFGSAGLYCYDFNGKELWKRDLGRQKHIWGWGSSPVLDGDLCILNFGPGIPSFLIAVNKKSGKTIWQVDEPNANTGEKKPGQEKPEWVGSWSTPLLIEAGGRDELVLSWPKRVVAFEPKTGKELWTCAGLNPLSYTSPLYDKGSQTVVAMGGFMGMALAVRAGGTGDVTQSHRLWHHPKTKQRIGSGVIHDGYIFILNDPGVAECFELKTGKAVWEERLKGPAAKSDNWSSLMLSGDKIYAINQGGDAFVLKAAPKFEVLATNSLAEATIASIAGAHGELFIRTHKALWCVDDSRK
jgi:outer membrane protein assembly factor BamB